MDIKLPGSGVSLPLPKSTAENGAFYRGLLVGVTGPNGVVRPLAARWPDAKGRFSLLLPGTVRGKTLHFWESDFVTFSGSAAGPGSAVDLHAWPSALPARIPRDLARIRVGR
jgi:hypothetical protein